MRKFSIESESCFFYAFLALFLALSALHMFTGYADNGDFTRSAGFIFEKPYGFSTMWPASGTEEFKGRFFSEWHDGWVLLSDWPIVKNIFNYSSYKLYLLLQAKISVLVTGSSLYYSIIFGSILSRVILLSSFIAILFYSRKKLPVLVFWFFTLLLSTVLLDSSWIAFLNSLYEEQVAIILLPVLGLFFLRFYEKNTLKTAIFLLVCATVIGSAKTAYFYVPSLIAFFLYPTFRSRLSVYGALLLIIVCQTIAFAPVYYGKYEKINSYQALYFGALKVPAKEETGEVKYIGEKEVLHECVGVAYFYPNGPDCMARANATYGDVARLLVSHPQFAVKMVARVFSEGNTLKIDYLGTGISRAPNFSDMRIFNVMHVAFYYGFNLFIFFLLLCSLLIFFSKKIILTELQQGMLKIGIFFALFGFSQYAISLSDGMYDITKHLAAGNYALALSFPFIGASLLLIVFSRLGKGRSHGYLYSSEKESQS